MIYLGLDKEDKLAVIQKYCRSHDIRSVVILCPPKFRLTLDNDIPCETILWGEPRIGPKNEIVQYRFYYRLIQEIDQRTLIVINECLRSQNRNDLTYNCIRQFLQQTRHQLIFNYLPLIDEIEDFMTLFDFDTRSQWKQQPFSPALLNEAEIFIDPVAVTFAEIQVETSAKVQSAYEKEKSKLFDGIGLKDPHTIPRNLYLFTGKTKLAAVAENKWYIGRNNRFKVPTLTTYRDDEFPHRYTVFEFCHNYLEFSDFLALSKQINIPVLTTDLRVDQWYLQRYTEWADRIKQAIAQIPHQSFAGRNDASPISQQNQDSPGIRQRAHQLSF